MKRLALVAVAAGALLAAPESGVQEGFDHFYNLEYEEAVAVFRKLIAAHPDNADYRNHLAEAILYRELFRVGALESELVSGTNPFLRRPKLNPSPEVEEEFVNAIATAMSLCEQRLKENANDTAALYTLGVAYGLRANYNFIVRKAWMSALRDATRSRKLHSKVVRLDPANIDARMVPAIHEYVVGSLPWYYRLLGFLAGFRGNKQEGIRTLELVARRGERNRDDARILLCVVYRRERQPAKAVPLLKGLISDFPRNYLLRMELVQMYSDLGEEDNAMAVIREMERLKRDRAPGYDRMPMYRIWYTRGTLQFWYGHLEAARADFENIIAVEHQLNLHTAQLAWFRLGQIYDLLGERDAAVKAYRKVIRYAADSLRARQAKRYLKKPCTVATRK